MMLFKRPFIKFKFSFNILSDFESEITVKRWSESLVDPSGEWRFEEGSFAKPKRLRNDFTQNIKAPTNKFKIV